MTMGIPQSTAYTVLIKAYLSTDHVSAATGKTLAVTLSKAGAAFGNPNIGASNATEVANGWYKFALDTTDTGSIGDLVVRMTASGVDDAERVLSVVSATTGGATNLDAAVSSRMATYTQPTGFLAATFPTTVASTTNITSATGVDTTKVGGVTQTGGDLFTAVTNIAVTSAALNTIASGATVTTGTQTNTYTSTATADGIFHSVADVAGTTDFYYQFDLSGTSGAVGVGVGWLGYVAGVVNTLKVYAYNWGGAVWDQVGNVVGIAGTTEQAEDWELTSAHTGTGGNAGLVRIRFSATGLTSSSTKTDRILLGYAVVITLPTNFSSLVIDGSGRVDLGKWIGTAPLALSSQQVQAIVPDTQKVDVETIKTNPVANAGTVTFPTNATLASTTNITSGTMTTVTTTTNVTTVNGLAANVITAASIAASALNGKGDWMVSYTQPTGFLAATFPTTVASTTNITAGTISTVTTTTNLTNLPAITAGWLTATGIATDAITAAKIAADADNEIAAAVFDLATAGHTTSGTFGAAVVAAGSLGDPWATSLPGSYGAGTAGFIVGTNLDALITSRMATYVQPTGFLAATFPVTVASTTNITAGTITTTTNLTNAPTSGDFTATMKTSVGTAVAASAVASVTGNVGGDVVGKVLGNGAGVLVDTGVLATTLNSVTVGGYNAGQSPALLVWQNLFSGGNFATAGSVGNFIRDCLLAAFTSTTSGVYTAPALANAPGGSAPTAAQIATAIFTDLLASSDFSTAASFGKLVKDNLDAPLSSLATTADIADKVLGRNIAGGSDGGRTVAQSLAVLRNKVVDNLNGTFTVYATDDITPLFTGTLTRSSTLGPVIGVDPA